MKFNYSLQPGRTLTNRYGIVTGEPLVSIITPFYNASKYFEQTYNSIINQTFPWFEWIIVDDGSTNETDIELVGRLAQTDSRIRLLHKENGGAASARIYGVHRSSTEYIAFLDADDLIEASFLEYVYFALKQNTRATWAYTDSLGFDGQEYIWEKDFSSKAMRTNNILPYCALIKKDVLTKNEYYDPETQNLWEDYQFWLKLLTDGHYPVHIKLVLFWYRRHGTGWLSKIENNTALKHRLQSEIKRLAKNVPDGIQAVTFDGRRAVSFQKPSAWSWERILPFRTQKTKILMLLPHMEMGGADKFNLDIITNINKNKYEIGIITTVPANSEWRQKFTEQIADVFELPSFLDMNDWSSFIRYYIQSRSVDIVLNISSYYGYYTLPWLRREFPCVSVIDCVHAEGKYWRSGGYPRLSAAFDHVLDKTFVTNKYTRDILTSTYEKRRDKTHVIYTGVDQSYFCPDNIDGDSVRVKFGIEVERPIVLYLCRLVPEKRPLLMLEIAKAVKDRINNVCFLVVGGGVQMREVKRRIKKDGLKNTVLLAGIQEDIRPFYKACDLFLLSSLKEGLSITTMEAMAMGKPIVSADVGSQYELVTPETGLLVKCLQDEQKDFGAVRFPQKEIEDYAEAVYSLLTSGRLDEMGRACRDKILNGLTLGSLIKTLENEFDALVSSDNSADRGSKNTALGPLYGVYEELITIYTEYESIQAEYRGAYRFMQYFKELITFRRSIFSILREVLSKKGNPVVKRLLRAFKR